MPKVRELLEQARVPVESEVTSAVDVAVCDVTSAEGRVLRPGAPHRSLPRVSRAVLGLAAHGGIVQPGKGIRTPDVRTERECGGKPAIPASLGV